MKQRVKGFLLFLAGILCVIAGIAGVFLPIIPGVPLLLLGLHLIGVRMPFLDRHVARFRIWLEARQNRNRSPRQS